MQRPPHTTSPAMSPASSHMSPVHCMSPGTSSHMSPVSMSPAGHMSPSQRQGSPQPNMVGMRPPIPAGQKPVAAKATPGPESKLEAEKSDGKEEHDIG